jgi:DNA processing protein
MTSDARDSLLDTLRLSMVPGVGPIARRALIARFGSPAAVLDASVTELRQVSGIGAKLASAIAEARNTQDAEAELAACRQSAIEVIVESDPRYPPLLSEIPDPPGTLFVKGDLQERDRLAIAVVGTRHATPYGLMQAGKLAAGLARAGVTIVSGLARGIDAAAHRATLEAEGRTIAVLGSGILNLYPKEHAELARQIVEHGAVISECPPGMPPMSGMFPQRNRIITGLALGVVVVEAADRSGALISARHAMEQGREVFAVPGRVDSRMSRGCHRLIRDGAKLVESVEDIFEELGPLAHAVPTHDGRVLRNPVELQLNTQEQAVLTVIDSSATSIDEIVRRSQLPVNRVLATLSVLEMRRLVRRLSGNTVSRV